MTTNLNQSTTIQSASQLEKILQAEINSTEQEIIEIFAGHMPVRYTDDELQNRRAFLDINRWGEFTTHTFELGCRLAAYAQKQGKQARILVVADDLVEAPRRKSDHRIPEWVSRYADKLYKKEGLPESLKEIMQQYKVEECLVPQERSFGLSEVISEMKLVKNAWQNDRRRKEDPNQCAVAYNELIAEEFISPDTAYLVSFIPAQCKGNICTGVLQQRADLDSAHVFFPHMRDLGGLEDNFFFMDSPGPTYQPVCNTGEKPMSAEEMYDGKTVCVRTRRLQ